MSILGVESPSGGSVGKPKCTVGSGPSRRRAFACFGGVVVAVFVAGAVWERYSAPLGQSDVGNAEVAGEAGHGLGPDELVEGPAGQE